MNQLPGEINQSSDEYSIIWYQPEIDFDLRTNFKEKKNVQFFSEFQEVVGFAKSLGSSFLMIVPEDFDEQLTFEDFNGRRLADIEEESILQRFCISEPFRVYAFCTKEDFESEVFVEEDVMKWDVKEALREFREEFILCERKQRGLEKIDAVFGESPGSADLWDEGDSMKCKEFCIRKLKELANKKGHEKMKLIYYVNLGKCYALEESQKALEYLSKAFDIVKQNYEDTHFSITLLMANLADGHANFGEYQKALEFNLKALDIRRTIYGETHGETAILYRSLGHIYDNLGRYQEAIEYYLKFHEFMRSRPEIPGEDVAALCFNIGENYQKLKEYPKALEYHQSCLEIRRSILGEINLEIARSYNCIGLIHYDLEEYEKALEVFLKSVDIKKSIFGEMHAETLIAYQNLGSVEDKLGQDQKAIDCYLKALEIHEALSNEPDKTLSFLNFDIGELYEKMKEYPKALECHQKALEIKRSIFGEVHIETANSLSHLGSIYFDLNPFTATLSKKESLKFQLK